MTGLYGSALRSENVGNMLNDSGEYGIVDEVQEFENSEEKLYVALLYNNINAEKSINALSDLIKENVHNARISIANGQANAFEQAVRPYIIVQKHRGWKKDTFAIDEEK